MGRFEGILLATDLDGTLAVGKEIPAPNREALARFVDGGGLLCLSSGRGADYLRRMEGVTPNAPFIAFNGTEIIHHETDACLWRRALEGPAAFAVAQRYAECGDMTVTAYFVDGTSAVGLRPDEITPDLTAREVKKIVYGFADPAVALAREEEMRRLFPAYQFVRSWSTGVEQIHPEAGKGPCVKWLRAWLGAKLLVCVGDEENDHSMLREADLSFCPANATPETKALCRRTVCSVSEGALAEVISLL